MKSKRWHLGAVLLAAVILVGAVSGMAFANTDDQTGKPDLTAMYQNFISKFAANLGVSEDQAKDALEATKKQMVNEAVEQGKLTQEQADKILSNDKGFGFPGFGFDRGRGGMFKGRGPNTDALANVLGITADQLKTEFQAGKKIEDIVTEHGMTMEQFNQKMLEHRKEELSKDVSEGKITQEQADQMIEKMGQRQNWSFPAKANN
ncbi:MAG: DUF2680 domain-containing protein [Bacillota bacterium]